MLIMEPDRRLVRPAATGTETGRLKCAESKKEKEEKKAASK